MNSAQVQQTASAFTRVRIPHSRGARDFVGLRPSRVASVEISYAATTRATSTAGESASTLIKAVELAGRLWRNGVRLERIVHSRNGDVVLYFFGKERLNSGARRKYAAVTIQASSPRQLLIVLEDRAAEQPQVEECDESSLAPLAGNLKTFLAR